MPIAVVLLVGLLIGGADGASTTAALGPDLPLIGVVRPSPSLRLTDVYVRFGQKTEAEYQSELRNFEAPREQLLAAASTKPPIRLDGLHGTWQKTNAAERRTLLGLLFDGLCVDDRKIVGWIPRSDRKAEVIELIARPFQRKERHLFPLAGRGGVRLMESTYTEALVVAWRRRS